MPGGPILCSSLSLCFHLSYILPGPHSRESTISSGLISLHFILRCCLGTHRIVGLAQSRCGGRQYCPGRQLYSYYGLRVFFVLHAIITVERTIKLSGLTRLPA